MSTIVYLSNQQVQVLVGTMGKSSITVKNVYEEEAPEGSIINGMIMDMESFTAFLKEFWSRHHFSDKDVHLVINSSKFVGKNMDMPAMGDAKVIDFIDREFRDMGREDSFIYSYITLPSKEKKIKRIYAEGIDQDFVKDYIDLFLEIGVKLKAVYSAEGSLISLVYKTLAKNLQTFVAVFADKISLTTILWVDGEFSYYNTSRCFHDRGTIEHAEDLARTVSQVSQFMQAHQMESMLQSVVIAGLHNEDLSFYSDEIHNLGITAPVELFKQSYINTIADMHEFIHAASGLFINNKWQDCLMHYNLSKKKKSSEDNKQTTRTLLLIGSCAFVMIFILVAAILVRETKKTKLMELQDYNNSPLTIDQTVQYDMLSGRNHYLNGQAEAINSLSTNLETYPRGNDAVYNRILSLAADDAELSFDSFNSDDGTISMVAKSPDSSKINVFISRLMEDEIFESVNYTGYAFNENEQLWDIHVTCLLAEAAGNQ